MPLLQAEMVLHVLHFPYGNNWPDGVYKIPNSNFWDVYLQRRFSVSGGIWSYNQSYNISFYGGYWRRLYFETLKIQSLQRCLRFQASENNFHFLPGVYKRRDSLRSVRKMAVQPFPQIQEKQWRRQFSQAPYHGFQLQFRKNVWGKRSERYTWDHTLL